MVSSLTKILKLDVVDGPGIVLFLNNLDGGNKALFFLGGLLLCQCSCP